MKLSAGALLVFSLFGIMVSCGTHQEVVKPEAETFIERECWRGICAGMQLKEVKKRLGVLGFKVESNWMSRKLLGSMGSQFGVFDYESYEEPISAFRGTKCDFNPNNRNQPCASLDIIFLRFPNGNRRLLSIDGAETLSQKRLASELIAEIKSVIGQPKKEMWRKWPYARSGETQCTLWHGRWGKEPFDWTNVEINLLENVKVKDEKLSPPEIVNSVHVSSVDFNFQAKWLIQEHSKALHGN